MKHTENLSQWFTHIRNKKAQHHDTNDGKDDANDREKKITHYKTKIQNTYTQKPYLQASNQKIKTLTPTRLRTGSTRISDSRQPHPASFGAAVGSASRCAYDLQFLSLPQQSFYLCLRLSVHPNSDDSEIHISTLPVNLHGYQPTRSITDANQTNHFRD